jgi:hypothetical protein
MADTGWEGRWEPNLVGEGTLNELRDRAGQPITTKRGTVMEWVSVNLRTGEVRYPARTGRGYRG